MLVKEKNQSFIILNDCTKELSRVFLQWTFEKNIPYTTIEKRRKYAQVIFDLIFIDKRLTEEEQQEVEQLICKLINPHWRDYSISELAILVDKVPIEKAPDFAASVNELLIKFINK